MTIILLKGRLAENTILNTIEKERGLLRQPYFIRKRTNIALKKKVDGQNWE